MTKQKHILIVEDERKIALLMEDYLKQNNYQISRIEDGAEVLTWLQQNHVDLILLDIMLPNVDGVTLCKEIRKTAQTPIIFLTAKVEEIDRIIGLEIGADDYVCKPFSPREVVARVATILRRSQNSNSNNSNLISLNETTYSVTLQGLDIPLTAIEFQLFKLLFEHPGRIYSRQQLMDAMYNDHRIVSARTIDSHIKKLRKKLTLKNSESELIHSVYGVGYKYQFE